MERRNLLQLSVAIAGLGSAGTFAAPAASTDASPAKETKPMPLRVQILMYDGVEEQDFIGPRDVFGHAVQAGGQVETTLVRPSDPGEVTCFFGTKVTVPTAWEPTNTDFLIVPGGGDQLIHDPDVLRNLVRAQQAGVIVAGVCTGVLVLSAAGLTKGRPCTTHHLAKAEPAAQGGKVIDARVVDDGNLVTSGGVTQRNRSGALDDHPRVWSGGRRRRRVHHGHLLSECGAPTCARVRWWSKRSFEDSRVSLRPSTATWPSTASATG